MSHARCVACKIRTRVRRPDQASHCPLCGDPLEQVRELGALFGFRLIPLHQATQPGADAVSVALFGQRVREALDREGR